MHLPGVMATLTEVQTNVVRTTTTGGRGNYQVASPEKRR